MTLGELLLKGTFARIYKGCLEDGSTYLIKTVSGEPYKFIFSFEVIKRAIPGHLLVCFESSCIQL